MNHQTHLNRTIFITGTDTDVGKTKITAGLLRLATQKGYQSLGIKPIASGSTMTPEGLRNEDALILQNASSHSCAYESLNPFCFEPAIAPHIAAAQSHTKLSIEHLNLGLQNTLNLPANFKLIEGAGGWHTPLNATEKYSDWVKSQNLPVILVVGIKLGAINHTFLTLESIQRAGLNLIGWVANCIDKNMPYQQKNIDYLQSNVTAPCLGMVPFIDKEQCASPFLTLP